MDKLIKKKKKQYLKAQQQLDAVIGKYGSLDNLNKSYNWYKKNSNDNKYKQCSSDNRKVYRLLQKINGLKEGEGQKRDVIKTKYSEHCGKVRSIIACYKSVKQLNEQSNAYRKSRKREYHEAYKDHERYNKTMKKIRLYEGEHNIKSWEKFDPELNRGIGSRVVDISVPEVEDEEEIICLNCHRKQNKFLMEKCESGSNELPYVITFCQHSVQEIKRQRKFKNIDASVLEESDELISLCVECSNHVTNDNESIYNDVVNVWPAFIWSLLNNVNVQNAYGKHIWKFIPELWRYWWIDECKKRIASLANVSIRVPKAIFVDRTIEIKEWNDDIKSLMLPRLRKACERNFLPLVLCPFGCSEFSSKVGKISLDIVFQRYIYKCRIKLMNKCGGLKYVQWTRDDYIRNYWEYDCWLLNEMWCVRPSIAFIEGVPYVLSCRDHDKGSTLMMIHPPRQPRGNLGSKYSDQLCHCVLRSRTIKPLQKRGYSTGYQMHEQRGTFNGIDTCNITSYRNFSIRSELLTDAESRSIINRPDINALLSQLVEDGSMSKFIANSKKIHARIKYDSFDFDSYCSGATYVPLEGALIMQRELSNSIVTTHDDEVENNSQAVVTYRKCWPSMLYPCQKVNVYGAMMLVIPKFCSPKFDLIEKLKSCLIWEIAGLLLNIEEIWITIATEKEFHTSEWYGWFLIYLSKKCLCGRNKNQACNDVFKWIKVCTVQKFVNTVKDKIESLKQAFENVKNVIHIDLVDKSADESIGDMICNSEGIREANVIIIQSYYVNVDSDIKQYFHMDDVCFKLCYVSRTEFDEDNNWDGEIYARHCNMMYTSWWHQKRKDNICYVLSPFGNLQSNVAYVLGYVRMKKTDVSSIKEEYMQYLGGQSHIKCEEHDVPLIVSVEKKEKCSCCDRGVYLTCPKHECRANICKKCFEKLDKNDCYTVTSESNEEDICFNVDDGESDIEYGNRRNMVDEYEKNGIIPSKTLEKDIFDEYLTCTQDPDVSDDDEKDNNMSMEVLYNETDSGETVLNVREDITKKGAYRDVTVSGSTIMNQCGSLLTRKKHQIKGSKKQKFFIQKLCATTKGTSVPLVYPEAMVFPSIFWKASGDMNSLVGAIPAPLLNETMSTFGFADIAQHVRSRLTFAGCNTSSDPRYITFAYDMLTNLAATHEDTRLVMQRGLTVQEGNTTGLSLRGKEDSVLMESFDSKQMVRNLCASQYYHKMDFFLTFTCNSKKHFGTNTIKNWLDNREWQKMYTGYFDLNYNERQEVEDSITQAAGVLLLRIWEEVSKLFLEYILRSPFSPYRNVLSMFARKEYQALTGNLSHIHLMLEVNWAKLDENQKRFVNDLCRCSLLDIVRPGEVQSLINDGTFKSVDDWKDMVNDAKSFLGHVCNSRCLMKMADGSFKCRKMNNLKVSKDNTKHTFMSFKNDLPQNCIDRLVKIGVVEPVVRNDHGYRKEIKSKLSFLHPKRHIPPTNPSDDINMSPCEGYTFANCLSMQNIQVLTQGGGVNKYICKYIGKLDEQNYIVVTVDPESNGQLIKKATFLHNTKVSGTKINEDKSRQNRKSKGKYPEGRSIAIMEQVHVMLLYPEVITNLNFVSIPSMPLEFRVGVALECTVADSAQEGNVSNDIRSEINLPRWRQHTLNQMRIYDDLKQSKVSVDRISVFSLRPPELLNIIDTTRNYFRWIHIEKGAIGGEELKDKLKKNIYKSCFVNCLQQQNYVRLKALPEIKKYILELEERIGQREINVGITKMINFFKRLLKVMDSNEKLSRADTGFRKFVLEEIIHVNRKEDHLPIPVYSYLKPTLGVQFIHHVMLSLGRFATEIDLTMQPTIRDSLRYAKLIGPSNDQDQLEKYSNELLHLWIKEQLQYFPIGRRVLSEWIVIAGELFDSIIIRDELSISQMPAVQLTTLFGSSSNEMKEYMYHLKETFVNAIHMELGESVEYCDLPSKEDILNASKCNPLQWDALKSFKKNINQSTESYAEQKLAIEVAINAIENYSSIGNYKYTKNVGFRGFPGSGKTWCSLYAALYAMSKGLFVLPTAVLAKRAIQLGGTHWHVMFSLMSDDTLTNHRKAELAIIQILKDPRKLHLLMTLDVLICDEIGQLAADFIAVIDIILRRIRGNSQYMGGLLILCTMDHTQIQSFGKRRPFLTSSHIIPCYRMVNLSHSVRAFHDKKYQRLQYICRLHYRKLMDEPALVDEFISLCSQCLTFVEEWNHPKITPSTMRLYSKKVPTRGATKEFAERVKRQIPKNSIRERISVDVEKSMNIQQDWYLARESTISALNQKVKEPRSLLFFKGAIYSCTFNNKGVFSQAQMALLYDLPSQSDVENWRPIKLLLAPPGLKSIEYDGTTSKEQYIQNGFKEISMGVCNGYTQKLKDYKQAKRKQYGLKHYVSATIHAAMGDTLNSMATSISTKDSNFELWDKGQLVVLISRTKHAKDSIFVGSKQDTLDAFKQLILQRNQWTDYVEDVLRLVTINECDDTTTDQILTQASFPYRIADVVLPQCNTGYVYMLISLRHPNYTYIGTTLCLRNRLQAHNCGRGAAETTPMYLRPFALFAYICGFNDDCCIKNKKSLRYSIEKKWKEKRDWLIRNGINNKYQWAKCGNTVIQNMISQNQRSGEFDIRQKDLTLICLF